MSGRRPNHDRRWIAALLRLYPRGFRERYGLELEMLYRDRYAGRGVRGVLSAVIDTLRDAPGARVEERTRRPSPGSARPRFTAVSQLLPLPLEGRQVFRGLARRPGFTLLVLLTLGLGIGSTTAFFGLVRSVVLRPLPYPDSDRLVRLWGTEHGEPEVGGTMAFLDIVDIASESQALAGVAAYDEWNVNLTGEGRPERLEAALVSVDYFEVLGARTAVGRFFLPEEDVDGQDRVVVLEHGFWQRRFGGDRDVVGRALVLGGSPHVVVGVVSADFEDPDLSDADRPPALWRPLGLVGVDPARLPNRGSESWVAVGRLRSGWSLEAAQAEVAAIAARLEGAHPETNTGRGVLLVSLLDQLVGDAGRGLVLLLGAVGALLAIAIANVTSMMLGRAVERSGETALRSALGADRFALLRFGVLEGLVLAAGSGVLGLGFAFGLSRAFVAFAGPRLPRVDTLRLDTGAFLFALALTSLVGLVCGLLPALRHSRRRVTALRPRGGGSDRDSLRLRGALVVLQVSLALVLLHGAGLLGRSFVNLARTDVGLDIDGLVAFDLEPPFSRYGEPEAVQRLYREVFAGLENLPGVRRASSINILPLSGGFDGNGLLVPGQPSRDPDRTWSVQTRTVSLGYFETAGLALRRGRSFTAADREGGPRVAVIGRAAAERFWPGADPVGSRVEISDSEVEIVGVAEDPRHLSLVETDTWWIYLPRGRGTIPWQERRQSVLLRMDDDSVAVGTELAEGIRRVVGSIDPELPVAHLRSTRDLVESSLFEPRLRTMLIGAFATLAVLLGALGIYGVASFGVALERQGLAVRMALGAGRQRIAGHVLVRIAGWTGRGVVLGLAGAWAFGRVLGSFLHGVDGAGVFQLFPVVAVLVLVALLAGWVPVRRAVRVDPATMLRDE